MECGCHTWVCEDDLGNNNIYTPHADAKPKKKHTHKQSALDDEF